MLEISSGIDDAGGLRMELLLGLFIAWTLVALCMIKGVRSLGKVSLYLLDTTYHYSQWPFVSLLCALALCHIAGLNVFLANLSNGPGWNLLKKIFSGGICDSNPSLPPVACPTD